MFSTRTLAALGLAVGLLFVSGCGSDGDSASDTTSASEAGSDAETTTAPRQPGEEPKLHENWPDELALPDGVTLDGSSSAPNQMTISVRIDGDAQTVFDTFEEQLTEAGYEIATAEFTPSDIGGDGRIGAEHDGRTVGMAFAPDGTGEYTQATITVIDTPGSGG